MSAILDQARKNEEERKRKFKEQQDRFYAEVARRQKESGQGIYGKHSDEYLKTKEGKTVAKAGDKLGYERGDVREQAKLKAESQVQARNEIIRERNKGKHLTAGQRQADGSRILSVTGERPIEPTKAEVDTRAKQIYQDKRRQQQEIKKYGHVLQSGEVPGKRNDPEFIAYRNLRDQAAKEGYEISGPVTIRETKRTEGNQEVTTTKVSGKLVEKPQSQTVIQGLTIVGGEPAPPISLDPFKVSRSTLSPENQAYIANIEQTENKKYSGQASYNAQGGLEFYFYDKDALKQYHDDFFAAKRANAEARKSYEQAQKNASEDEQKIRDVATRSGYTVSKDDSGITLNPTGASTTQVKFVSASERKSSIAEQNARGYVVNETRLSDGSYVHEYIRDPNFKEKTPSLSVGEQLYRGTVTYGGGILADILDLAGEGEVRLAEFFGAKKEDADKFRESGKKTTEEIRKRTSLDTLGGFYEGIGNLTDAKQYQYAALDARNPKKQNLPVGSGFSTLVAETQYGLGAVTGREDVKDSARKDIEAQRQALTERPIEYITGSAVDIGSFVVGGGEIAKGAKITKEAISYVGSVTKATIKGGEASLKKSLEKITPRKVSDTPIRVSPEKAKSATIAATKKETGIILKPNELEVIGLKSVNTQGIIETVPVKAKRFGRTEKPTSYEIVTSKTKETVGLVTKEGTTVGRDPLNITQAYEKVGQKIGKSGKIESTKPKEGDINATSYTEITTTESTGLRKATAEKPIGVTDEPSGAVFTESEKGGSLFTSKENPFIESNPILAEPKTYITNLESTKVAQTKKTGALVTYGTDDVARQLDKYHNTPAEIQRFYDEIPNDQLIQRKVAKQEKVLTKPRQELNAVDNEISSVDNELSSIEAERTALADNDFLVTDESVLAANQERLATLNERADKLAVKRVELSDKRAKIQNKIKFLTKRYSLKRHDFLGARQRVFKRHADRSDTPKEKLEKRGINKGNVAGLTVQLQKTTAPKAITKLEKQSVVERAFSPEIKRENNIGLGGGVSTFAQTGTLGLGGQTGAERKKKRETEEYAIFDITTPPGYESPVKPFALLKGTLGVLGEQSTKQATRERQKTTYRDILTTETARKVEKVPQSPLQIITIPSQSTRETTKERTERKTDSVLIPVFTPAHTPISDSILDSVTKQTPITKQVYDTVRVPRPEPRTKPIRPLFVPFIGFPDASSGGGGRRGKTDISGLAVANILAPVFSIRGTGEQKGGAERLLSLSAKKPTKSKRKKKRSILSI